MFIFKKTKFFIMGDSQEGFEKAKECKDLNEKIKVARKFTEKTEKDSKKEIGKKIAYKLEIKKREEC